MRRSYHPSLVVALTALAIVVGIALKSYTREQRIVNVGPVPSTAAESFGLFAKN